MEDKNASRSKNMWIVFGILVVIVGVAVVLALPAISATSKIFLLGSGLIAAGIWGTEEAEAGIEKNCGFGIGDFELRILDRNDRGPMTAV